MKKKTRTRTRMPALGFPAWLAVSVLMLAGCVRNPPKIYGVPGTAPSAAERWTPPPALPLEKEADSSAATFAVPEDLLKEGGELTLARIVDVALRSSPATAQAWARARSAAAEYGSKKGAYYPSIGLQARVDRSQGSFANGDIAYFQRSYSPAAVLSWTLFDSGGRKAALEETRNALVAADWTHNAVIQDTILAVEEAYYDYVTAKGLAAARRAAYEEARKSLDAAEERHEAGVATIADVLQAKTALAQAKLALDGVEGTVQTTRGALATAMGMSADFPYDVAVPSGKIPLSPVDRTVESLLKKAESNRPDLAAAKALARKAKAHVAAVKAEAYPSLVGSADLGRTYYDRRSAFGNTYHMGVLLKVPLFNGFTQRYNVFKAEADEEAERAKLKSLEQRVALEVWASYYALKTASQRVRTSRDLMQSATESHEVALGRYKAGVGGILDLLAAQRALEDARAQRVQARAEWFLSVARLAHDAGMLEVSGVELPAKETVSVEGKDAP